MSASDAEKQLVLLVNEALEAGLQGKPRPSPFPVGKQVCTDQELSPTGEISSLFTYTFPFRERGIEGDRFANLVTATWRRNGMEIVTNDQPGSYHRFASSEEGFELSVSVLEDVDQITIGGSGPCLDPTN